MRRQRNFCRFIFILIGIAPLLATIGYAGWRNHRYDAGHFSDYCGRSFGCLASVGDARYIRPGVLRMVQVSLADSETGQTVLRCDAIEIERQGGAVHLSIPSVEVATPSADQLLFAVHERVLRQPRFLEDEVIVSIGNLRFAQAGSLLFSNNTIEMRRIENGTEMRAEFCPSGSAKPVDLTIRRHMNDSGYTKILLETWQHELPTSLLVGHRNWLPQLTPAATFRGNIWCELEPNGWSGEVVGGYLRNIDLTSFVGTTCGGWITGTANIMFRAAKFKNGRLQALDAVADSPAGQVHTQQLTAATDTWQLSWSEQPSLDMPVVDYRELSCGITLTDEGFELRGRAEPTQTILTLATGERLSTDPDDQVHAPATTILTVLFPGRPAQDPHSSEAEGLLHILPLPAIH